MGLKEADSVDCPCDPSGERVLTRAELIQGSLVYLFPGRRWRRDVGTKKYCGGVANSRQLSRASSVTLVAVFLVVFGIGFLVSGFVGQRRVTEQLIMGGPWHWSGWLPVALITAGGLFVMSGTVLACISLYMWVTPVDDSSDCPMHEGSIPETGQESVQSLSEQDSGTVFATFDTPGSTARTTRIPSKTQFTISSVFNINNKELPSA